MLVALVEHLKVDERQPPVAIEENRSRALRLGTAPLSIACALLVLAELAALAKVIPERWDTYTLATDNVGQLAGRSCGLSDSVYVEDDPASGVLPASDHQPEHPVPDARGGQDESPRQYLAHTSRGFARGGLPDTRDPAEGQPTWTPPNRIGPVSGSYGAPTRTGEIRTPWSGLPERARTGEVPVVVSAAGTTSGANAVTVEFGRDTAAGFEILDRVAVGRGGDRSWSDERVPTPEAATKVRLVAEDRALDENGWLAVSPPRAPQLTPMTDVVGDDPAFVEWTAAMVHACANMTRIRNGIAELPRYRISGGQELRDMGQGWSAPNAGGPFGYLNVATSMAEVPTYLRNDGGTDWGSLYEVHPYEPDALPATAAADTRIEQHWGWWRPGPPSTPITLPGDAPASNDRSDIQPGPR
nr:arabinosyltransferase C-terminal domain-containing protein [Saccharopolyspora sp. HNM0983]